MARWFGALTVEQARGLVALPLPSAIARLPRPEGDPLRAILAFDQQSWLPDNLLERGDRMTMAASIEARMPFMDHRLAAYVSALPDRCRVRGATTKWVLRRAMERILPPSIIARPKIGFRVPVAEWFRHQWRDMVIDTLLGPSSQTRSLYRPEQLGRLVHEHLDGRRNHEKLIWSWLTLELFQREFRVAV
jgi:asparagine synthase (glutamine-hydrolysing)